MRRASNPKIAGSSPVTIGTFYFFAFKSFHTKTFPPLKSCSSSKTTIKNFMTDTFFALSMLFFVVLHHLQVWKAHDSCVDLHHFTSTVRAISDRFMTRKEISPEVKAALKHWIFITSSTHSKFFPHDIQSRCEVRSKGQQWEWGSGNCYSSICNSFCLIFSQSTQKLFLIKFFAAFDEKCEEKY